VSYRLLVAGEPNAIADYRSFVEARANEAVELVSVRDARPALRVTLELPWSVTLPRSRRPGRWKATARAR
jgi:hypothetical protein